MRKCVVLIIILCCYVFLKSEEKEVANNDPGFVPIKEKVSIFIIKNSDSVIYRTVNIAIGEVFVLEFPADISLDENPTIGDAGLLKIEVETEPLKMKIWGLIFPEMNEESMYGLSSNVQFKINSGQTFIFNLVLSPAANSSNRIIFSYPEWENSQKEINKQLETLRKELDEKFRKKSLELEKESEKLMVRFMAQSFSEFFQCSSYSARKEESLVFLRSDRICKIGKDGVIAVNFSIKNRNRQRFHIENVKIYSLKGGKVELDNAVYHLDRYSMQFDEIVSGALAFKLKDEDYSTEYIIEVVESAGKKRKIDVKVSF